MRGEEKGKVKDGERGGDVRQGEHEGLQPVPKKDRQTALDSLFLEKNCMI